MANYKVVMMIKQEEKKIYLAVSQEDEELVKFKSIGVEEDYKQVITDVIAEYPTELEEFKKKEVKTSPVKLKKNEKEEKKVEEVETPKEEKTVKLNEETKKDLFETSKKQEQPKEIKEEKQTEEVVEEDLMDMMEE